MTTLVRNPTLSFSRRHRYEPLGLHGKDNLLKSISYRRRRAKQRQIFLSTYKLSSLDNNNFVQHRNPKLKKVAVKVKKIMASVLLFMRTGSFRSCNSKSVTSAASPVSIRKTFWRYEPALKCLGWLNFFYSISSVLWLYEYDCEDQNK